MNDARLDDLIQRVLEGAASADERELLERRLAGDAEARARHDQLAGVFLALGEARLEEPPAGLRDDVMREVRRAHAARAARPRRPALRLALPLAAGFAAVALAIVALSGRLGSGPGRGRVSGALIEPGAANPVLTLGPADQGVSVSAARGDGGRTTIVVEAGAPARVRISVDPAAAVMAPATGQGPGVRLETAQPGIVIASLSARASLRLECEARTNDATVRVIARLADGSAAEGAVPLDSLPWTRRHR